MIAAALVALALLSPSVNRWEVVEPYNPKLERMQECETGDLKDPWEANTGNGYYGGLQFSLKTWRATGGKGYPHQARKLEQKYRAVILIKKMGYGYTPWPICGKR